MPFARVQSAAFVGLDALLVDIEIDLSHADKLHAVVVGLPDTAVRESKDRVFAALKNSQQSLGEVHCTINLAPGTLRKEGPLYDLPIALGILAALGKLDCAQLTDYLIVGELGLSGEVRPVMGALSVALLARRLGKKGVILPLANAREADTVPGLKVIAVENLQEALCFSNNPSLQTKRPPATTYASKPIAIDFADVRGQAHVKRALEIAAAGAHNLLMCGPPGSGKTMLAKALISIMPDFSLEEALETTRIHSLAGLLKPGESLVRERPFRAPHHTVSFVGMVGGGSSPRPGEVSLAHHGILFLDELPEFNRSTLEVLRQPLEDRTITITRAQGSCAFPAHLICVAAMNPCPCGFLGHPDKPCRDSRTQIEQYRRKISGPLLDRLDMHIDVPPLKYHELHNTPATENSATIKQRVTAARERQYQRYGSLRANAQLSVKEIKQHCTLDPSCRHILAQAVDTLGLSARSHDRILKISRTIADLAGEATIREEDLMEALSLRLNLSPEQVPV